MNIITVSQQDLECILESKIESAISKAFKTHHEEQANNPNERLTREEVSNQYKVSYPTIHKYMNNGSLPFQKVGAKTLFKRSEVEKFFASKKK